jgi:hypothetical protein
MEIPELHSDSFESTIAELEEKHPARLAEFVAEKMMMMVRDMRL